MTVTTLSACRVCKGTDLEMVLNLGDFALNAFPETQQYNPHAAGVPLALTRCRTCTSVQLMDTVPAEYLFQHDYWYASGINGMMREELRNVVREARSWARVADGDWVLDIGANDGTLMNAWREHAWEGRPFRMAIEPSPTFSKLLEDTCEAQITGLFPAKELEGSEAQFKVITSIAMFYAVPDPVGFAREVKRLLHPDGVWIVQMQDLQNMVKATAFDNICHEHLIYYDIRSFWYVCAQAGLRVVCVQPREINGGSLRFVVQHVDRYGTVNQPPPIHEQDIDWGAFAGRTRARVERLKDTVHVAKAHGHAVHLLGASTKGNITLQMAELGPDAIDMCWERHPKKIGRHTVTGIPIVSEEWGRSFNPDLLVCPIWQFRHGIIEREHEYLQNNGRIYFPLPDGDLFFGTKE